MEQAIPSVATSDTSAVDGFVRLVLFRQRDRTQFPHAIAFPVRKNGRANFLPEARARIVSDVKEYEILLRKEDKKQRLELAGEHRTRDALHTRAMEEVRCMEDCRI